MKALLNWLKVRRIKKSGLTHEEVARLKNWVRSADTQLAVAVMEAYRPDPVVGGNVNERAMDALSRLAEIRGWESYRDRLLALGYDNSNTPNRLDDFNY